MKKIGPQRVDQSPLGFPNRRLRYLKAASDLVRSIAGLSALDLDKRMKPNLLLMSDDPSAWRSFIQDEQDSEFSIRSTGSIAGRMTLAESQAELNSHSESETESGIRGFVRTGLSSSNDAILANSRGLKSIARETFRHARVIAQDSLDENIYSRFDGSRKKSGWISNDWIIECGTINRSLGGSEEGSYNGACEECRYSVSIFHH